MSVNISSKFLLFFNPNSTRFSKINGVWTYSPIKVAIETKSIEDLSEFMQEYSKEFLSFKIKSNYHIDSNDLQGKNYVSIFNCINILILQV